MSIQDDETLQLYVEESLEQLADVENDLLIIEEAGADIDLEMVNKVFRAAHSIKGGGGFLGLETIKELAHKMENILGLIRSHEIVPTPEVINILLLAFDKLRDLINNVEHSNNMDISEHVVALNGLLSVSLPLDEKKAISNMIDVCLSNGSVIFRVSEFDISQAKKNRMFIYVVEYDLIYDVQMKEKTPVDIVSELQEVGSIIDSKVDVTVVGTLDSDISSLNKLPFLVLFSSIIEPDSIGSVLDIEEKSIHLVNEDMVAVSYGDISSATEPQPEETSIQIKSKIEEKPIKFHERSDIQETNTKDEAVFERSSMEGDMPIKGGLKDLIPGTDTQASKPKATTSIRVQLGLLDSLMTLAGELVLSRNQLLQVIGSNDPHDLELIGQKIDLVTSELQEAIMLTRMQPIGNVFNKFPRVVRDMAKGLNKEIELLIDGQEVELDKTIIEAISDPLTHLVRNAVDHGIEMPDERIQAGKDEQGRIAMRAYHEAGQVNIEISDDGRGLDENRLATTAVLKELITEEQARVMSKKEKINLIFTPGFSMADKITDVSGRGVGMDVVKTNLDKLGGVIEIDSEVGEGTTIRIKLPLTLAIIPSQIISVGKERYAIPQVNIDELMRISASKVKDKIEKVGDAEVVRLREQLLPLLNLADVLEVERTYIDLKDGIEKKDRRKSIVDRRSKKNLIPISYDDRNEEELEILAEESRHAAHNERCDVVDRRYHANSAVNIVVVSTGVFTYGLVVGGLLDSEEIVVKPLGRHLRHCKGYAGATIMGDGHVALILDVAGIARMAKLSSLERIHRVAEAAKDKKIDRKLQHETQSLLVFMNGENEQFAVPLDQVSRIEKIKAKSIELVSGRRVIQYRETTLPLFTIDEVANVKPLEDKEDLQVIVFDINGREIGLLTTGPVDAMEISIDVDDTTLKQSGIMGSTIIGEHTTLLVDIYEMLETLNPDWFTCLEKTQIEKGKATTILLAEDSNFFRKKVRNILEDEGYDVIEAEDGRIAWNLLKEHADEVSLVVTDIEMPNMDGLSLTLKIKEDKRFSHLPVITLTCLAGEEDIKRGEAIGVDDYNIKLDKESLMKSIKNHLDKN
ncbi:MAG: chemotaxis protein CheW [Thermodesulfobacteriota bacterium]|nr:chemotaxis protein CheW [Thermodesulfobacteriota bacterium]